MKPKQLALVVGSSPMPLAVLTADLSPGGDHQGAAVVIAQRGELPFDLRALVGYEAPDRTPGRDQQARHSRSIADPLRSS